MAVSASIVVPTRSRADYLRVCLLSVLPQAAACRAEVVVVRDGPDPATDAVCSGLGVRCVEHASVRGLNAARNTGVGACSGELVCFLDDDVEVRPGWLS